MRVLVHLGLNKCGSTYLQHALDAARPMLAQAGTCYPSDNGPPGHYGLSKHYGFGPGDDAITARPVEDYLAEARSKGSSKLILSSEYLSLYRPKAAAALHNELVQAGVDVSYLLLSRPILGWVKSLFNQYVRTVDDGRYLPNIDAYIDQVLANKTVDVEARHRLWSSIAGGSQVLHVRLEDGLPQPRLLDPFSAFAGVDVPIPTSSCAEAQNASVSANTLFAIGKVRQRPSSPDRDQALARLIAGDAPQENAPDDYLEVSDVQHARLQREIIDRYDTLSAVELSDRLSLWHWLGRQSFQSRAAAHAQVAA